MIWSSCKPRPAILRIFLSGPRGLSVHRAKSLFPDAAASTCVEIERLADGILAFLSGEDVSFSLKTVLLERCSAFQQKVLRAEHGIPRGRVNSYREIAGRIGAPRSARAVGTSLANNPFPIVVPCHRAIRSDGSIGGYQGGTSMKRTLLQMEGLRFDASGRIARTGCYYEAICGCPPERPFSR